MEFLQQSFSVHFDYKAYFTTALFDVENNLFFNFLTEERAEIFNKILFVIDAGVVENHPLLLDSIRRYFNKYNLIELIDDFVIIPGGEIAKNDPLYLATILEAVNKQKIDRHSYLAAIGGGAVLDLAGFAAATAHRGIKHIRIPTTVLSQNDSGIGVKNGINAFGKKNFIGTFCPPHAVFNDDQFLDTLDQRNWMAGVSEAIKVALIKDSTFFSWIENNSLDLVNRNKDAMNYLIKKCAALHLHHIAGSDPFERASARPLDFGHWSAHKIEQLSDFAILHGEAVAIGIALDATYSFITKKLTEDKAKRICGLLFKLGYDINMPVSKINSESSPLLQGLAEFREHLGGKLSIPLLCDIGQSYETNEISNLALIRASCWLNECYNEKELFKTAKQC